MRTHLPRSRIIRTRPPHACNDGWVTIAQIALDPETGEEVEEYAFYLCRKCAERS
jgi:hypothetical protein